MEPEDDPEQVIERMERLIDTAAADRDPEITDPDAHPIARNHAEAVRRGAEDARTDE